MRARLSPRLSLFLVVALLAAACNTAGPRAVRTARGAYNEVAVRTWNEQLLLNLVRLRYRDTPFFLEISSVSTSYSLEGSASLAGVFGSGENDVGTGLGGSYSESPTITYTPLDGESFVQQLLSPIPLATLFLLPQAGWSVERVFRCCVQRLNELRNAPSAAGPTPDRVPTYRDFRRAAGLLRRLQVAEHLDLGVRRAVRVADEEGEAAPAYVLRFSEDPAAQAEIEELRELLDSPAASGDELELRLAPGTLDRTSDELAVHPRSLMGVLFFLSQAVEPPVRHEEAGLVTVTRDDDGNRFDWSEITGDLMRVRSSEDRPESAFVAVRYRGYWFWIDDADLVSKSTFGLLATLFSLQSGDEQGMAPLLTLAVGR